MLDFNLACAFRLEIHENDRAEKLANRIAVEVSKIFSSGQSTQTPEDAENLHPMVQSDPYANADTTVW